MFFYLTTLNLVRFLNETGPQVEPLKEGQPSNGQAVQAVEAWKHLEFLCHNYVLNGLADSLYNVYCKTTTAKELWELLECKYKTEDTGKRKRKKKNDKKGKWKAEYLAPKAGIMKQKFQGTCYNCDQPGHRAANYKMPKRVNPRQANMVNDNVDMIAMVSNVIAMIFEVNMVGFNNSGWWVDTRATRHVCADKSMFRSFRAADNREKLYMGNSATADIKGIGDVILKMISEKELKLTNVLYVLEIRKNLITRSDLAYAVRRLTRYTSNPSVAHWKAMTRVLHYLRYNRDYGLHYDRYPAVIEGYNDTNWISNIKDSRSTSGYVFTLGGAAISWKSSKQTVIAKSTMESKFIALDKCGEEAEWLRQFVEDIPRAHSTVNNGKSRHIRRRHNSIRQLLSTGVISIDYVKSKDNIADPLTKGLSRELVSKFVRMAIDTNVTAPVNVTGAPVTNTVANHAEKPKKFNGQNSKRWQQKMFFYLTTLNFARFLNETAPQVQDLQVLLHDIHAEGMTVSEAFQVAAIIEKLPPSWVDFKNYLKHKRKEMSIEDLIVRLRIKEDNKLA
ncbi:retrovirus-related pol polyprotein from transposon TNT 1-94 [Tanacetum coccineum]